MLQRRRERDASNETIRYTGYDIYWPDGRPVSVGLERFCQHGTRLLVGRFCDAESTLVRLTLFPVANLEAALTRPGPGVRCRRFYALRQDEGIRLHFFTGTPTEVLFNPEQDEPAVLSWLHADAMRWGVPFWFDLGSQIVPHQVARPSLQFAGS
jgi:hypothetical protein